MEQHYQENINEDAMFCCTEKLDRLTRPSKQASKQASNYYYVVVEPLLILLYYFFTVVVIDP